jgi:DNA invertase Pin-like site-specific DNA recombinase
MTETHPEKRLIGYARVSTYGQTLSQLEQLRKAGCSSRNIYREKVTGARPDRRELNRMLGKLAPGDVVTVTRIDRLARTTPGKDRAERTRSPSDTGSIRIFTIQTFSPSRSTPENCGNLLDT